MISQITTHKSVIYQILYMINKTHFVNLTEVQLKGVTWKSQDISKTMQNAKKKKYNAEINSRYLIFYFLR